MSTPTTTTPSDLAALTVAAERAKAQAAEASASASVAQAAASAAAERIHIAQDVRFVSWASGRVADAPATEKGLAAEVDAARLAFEASVAAGEVDFVARYLSWAGLGARLYHHRTHTNNLRGHLHQRRPNEHPAHDAARQTGHDSRTSVPNFGDALDRAVATAAAARSGDAEDGLQRELEAALRGEDIPAPDRRDA